MYVTRSNAHSTTFRLHVTVPQSLTKPVLGQVSNPPGPVTSSRRLTKPPKACNRHEWLGIQAPKAYRGPITGLGGLEPPKAIGNNWLSAIGNNWLSMTTVSRL